MGLKCPVSRIHALTGFWASTGRAQGAHIRYKSEVSAQQLVSRARQSDFLERCRRGRGSDPGLQNYPDLPPVEPGSAFATLVSRLLLRRRDRLLGFRLFDRLLGLYTRDRLLRLYTRDRLLRLHVRWFLRLSFARVLRSPGSFGITGLLVPLGILGLFLRLTYLLFFLGLVCLCQQHRVTVGQCNERYSRRGIDQDLGRARVGRYLCSRRKREQHGGGCNRTNPSFHPNVSFTDKSCHQISPRFFHSEPKIEPGQGSVVTEVGPEVAVAKFRLLVLVTEQESIFLPLSNRVSKHRTQHVCPL